jgi:CubicO group peptidase (beta-lactamase class C family)
MHTSGLPSVPENIAPEDGDDPWADYTVQQMYEYLGKCKLEHRIGSKVDYSNLGMGLLGHLLALRAGTNFEALVISRICEPLRMKSTRIILSPEMKNRLATGHSEIGPPVKNWGSLALQGDGALYSTVNDMLKFLAANMGRGPAPLCDSMAKTHAQRKKVMIFTKIGLGWMHLAGLGLDLIWHNGETGGYHSYIGFEKSERCGVVVLANEANDIDDLGPRIVLPDVYTELDKFRGPKQRTAVKIDPAVYDHYVGEYKLNRRESMAITRKGDRLIARASGPGEVGYTVLPESETDFFYTVANAQIHFVTNSAGDATQLILFQNGKKQKAVKVK